MHTKVDERKEGKRGGEQATKNERKETKENYDYENTTSYIIKLQWKLF